MALLPLISASKLRTATDLILDKAERVLSAPAAARGRYALANRDYFYPFGTAMNGQTARLEAVRQIMFRCGIRQIVETGTFRGTTTEWLADFGWPVASIESNITNYHFSKLRLQRKPNVRVEFGSSVDVLPKFPGQMDTSLPTFFYLDAHWENYLPLRDEMRFILGSFSAPVILIDDFQVPGEDGYSYDDYGPGKALTTEYLADCLPAEAMLFYPSTPSCQETGWRRGWIVVAPNPQIGRLLENITLLRRQV